MRQKPITLFADGARLHAAVLREIVPIAGHLLPRGKRETSPMVNAKDRAVIGPTPG